MDAARCLPKLKVLVAEDNLINQRVIGTLLSRFGWESILAANGKEALERFLESRFDLVLMDVQMPEVDGFEAARLIRQKEKSAGSLTHTPIVAVTAHAGKQEHDRCLAAGMDAVITKPVSPTELLTVIASVLAPGIPIVA